MKQISNAAKTRYNMAHYEQIHLWIPMGKKKIVEMAARAKGDSVNRYVAAAIEAALERDGLEVAKMRLDKYEKIG